MGMHYAIYDTSTGILLTNSEEITHVDQVMTSNYSVYNSQLE